MSPISAEILNERIESVRAFNRFYTRQIGLLADGVHRSEYSLTQARVLYEIAHRDGPIATDLARDLKLDPGYLSRLLKHLRQKGLIVSEASIKDARRSILRLSASGAATLRSLETAARRHVQDLLDGLDEESQRRLLQSMGRIETVLGGRAQGEVPYILRPHQPGDIGWITHRQGLLYHQEYGWDGTFEAFVAEIAAAFVLNFDPTRERCWIAEREDEIVGSVFLVRQSDEVAKLRMLYVEPAARGLGIGRRLVDECVRFARSADYRRISLWTNDILLAARRIYEAAGFRLISEGRHQSFGKDLVGQNWELDL